MCDELEEVIGNEKSIEFACHEELIEFVVEEEANVGAELSPEETVADGEVSPEETPKVEEHKVFDEILASLLKRMIIPWTKLI